jgi:hypothetical protein
VAWSLHLLAGYWFASAGCRLNLGAGAVAISLHVIALLAGAVIVMAARSAWPHRNGRNGSGDPAPFLAGAALVLDGVFLGAILIAEVFTLALGPCR